MVRFAAPRSKPSQELEITRFLGANLDPDPTQLQPGESPDMLNITIDSEGTPDKRTGYTKAFDTSLGTGQINGLFRYDDTTAIIAHGTKLYSWDYTSPPVEIYSGVTDAKMRGFLFDSKLYLLNGHEYLVFDGSSVAPVVPYIPTLMVSCLPDGTGGTAVDEWNLLGTGFKQQFVADGTSTVYHLLFDDLDATETAVVVDGQTLAEGVDYSVDRTVGTIDFSGGSSPFGAPPDSNGLNSVTITAYKTFSGKQEMILGCKYFGIYGGSNDTRVHLAGNPSYPGIVRRSGIRGEDAMPDPSYFPENAYDSFGTNASSVVGFAVQYDTQVVIKQDSIWQETFDLNSGDPQFYVKPLNSTVGCVAPDSIQLLENNPVFLSENGIVYALVSSSVRDERNVQPINTSRYIDRDIIERDYENAISVDYNGRYMLAFPDGYVWVYDYKQDTWCLWNNIFASCFMVAGEYLYFGSSQDGMVYRFKKRDEQFPFNDDGAPIEAYFDSHVMNLGSDGMYKIIEGVRCTLRPGDKVGVDIYVGTNKKKLDYLTTFNMNVFAYDTLDYSTFTYLDSIYPQVDVKRTKFKRVIFFQLRFSNNKEEEAMGLLGLGIKFKAQKEVK